MDLTQKIYLAGFILAAIMGATANKTNFCTMGAVSDWVNMGDTGRFRAWVFAIAVAIIGVMIMQLGGLVDMSLTISNNTSQPPYRTPSFVWPRYILGGLIFGIGMVLGSGCGNKTMVRIGGGNLKSIVVFIMIGISAYLMLFTDFFYLAFLQWMAPISPTLTDYGIASQDLGAIAGGVVGMEDTSTLYYIFAGAIGLGLLAWAFKSKDFRGSFDNILGGAVVGLVVVGAWYVTAGDMGQSWLEEIEWMEQKPRAFGAQSFTFIAPTGQSLYYLQTDPANFKLVTFAMVALVGVIVGSFVWALFTRAFRFEWFASGGDAVRHIIGGLLMGIGGVLGMGCTIGQGITGFSTLALGSILTFGSIVLGSALTMKVQYYKMVYEAEATFGKALVTALVDLRMLPAAMRKLEAI